MKEELLQLQLENGSGFNVSYSSLTNKRPAEGAQELFIFWFLLFELKNCFLVCLFFLRKSIKKLFLILIYSFIQNIY